MASSGGPCGILKADSWRALRDSENRFVAGSGRPCGILEADSWRVLAGLVGF